MCMYALFCLCHARKEAKRMVREETARKKKVQQKTKQNNNKKET